MKQIALNHTAAKILLALLLNGEEFIHASTKDQMMITGCAKDTTFYAARKELVENGYIALTPDPHNASRLTISPLNAGITINIYNSFFIGNAGVTEGRVVESEQVCAATNGCALPPTSTIQEPSTPIDSTYFNGRYPHSMEALVPPLMVGTPAMVGTSMVGTFMDKAREVDEMDNSGDLALVKSPAAQRRKAQLDVVIEAYGEITHDEYPLTPSMAKTFLSLHDNFAVDTIASIQDVIDRHPQLLQPREDGANGIRTYMLKVFKTEKEKRKDPEPNQASPREVSPGELRERPIKEQVEIDNIREKLIASGKMPKHWL